MPSPAGHLIAGLAIGWTAQSLPTTRRGGAPARTVGGAASPLVLACVALAAAPDLDILTAAHRTWTHSLGAVALVAAAAAAFAWRRRLPVALTALACAASVASHVLLDWLGRDGSPPIGLTALWPLSHAYFYSGLDVFAEVSRRYWKPDEFIGGNLRSIARELAILLPFAAASLWLRHRAAGQRPRP